MTCTDARRHWMLVLDGEGDPALHLRIQEHVGSCADCATWFADQQSIERRIAAVVSSGQAAPELWRRVLSRATTSAPAPRRRRRAMAAGVSAVLTVAALVIVFLNRKASVPTELSRNAADWHEQWERGNVRPDLESTSDQDVDRYLKARVPFRVHCPPRTDVQFSVQGAGVCFMKDRRRAAYIVGRVGKAPVTILVLDRSGLDGFPPGFHHRTEGAYRVASAVIAENVVIVIGTTPPEILERLLNAYGSYHEG